MASLMVPSEGMRFSTPSLIIKPGRGRSVGLWKNSQLRYGYVKIPADSELVILYEYASINLAKVGNCAYVKGKITSAKVGNTINCQGNILKASVGNRCSQRNVVVRTLDEEREFRAQEQMKIMESMKNSGFFSGLSADKEETQNYEKRKVVIRLQGDIEQLRVEEPKNITTEVLIYGVVGTLYTGNCLSVVGGIEMATARNCINALNIGEESRLSI